MTISLTDISHTQYNKCTICIITLIILFRNLCREGGIAIIIIDVRSPKPIYEQIKDNIKQLIITGALKEGEKLPSVRELAQTTSINPNTIQKAYKDLESEGFIYSVLGRGNFVAAPPVKKDQERIDSLIASIRLLIRELHYLGLTRQEILDLIDKTISADEEGKPHD